MDFSRWDMASLTRIVVGDQILQSTSASVAHMACECILGRMSGRADGSRKRKMHFNAFPRNIFATT